MWTLASLPVSLLLLVGAQIATPQPRPISIRKMPPDSNEKLLDSYLAFAPADLGFEPHQPSSIEARGALTERESLLLSANSSAQIPFRPAFGVHQEPPAGDGSAAAAAAGAAQHAAAWAVFRRAAAALAALQRRQWSCPSGTSSCAAIGFQYYCCHTGEMCYKVTSGAGPVGCCPSGATCGGSVGSCANGDTACPSALGGGCCIAGYVCQDVGCVLSAPSPPASQPATTSTTTSTDIISSHPSQSTIVVTVVVTQTQNGGGTSLTTLTTTRTTTTQAGSGPSSTTTAAATTTDPGSAALKPTFSGYCPTGFYACFASAGGGCCQTGRDCATASCPPLASTTVVSNGKTVVVPATGVPASARSTCGAGWFLCGPDAGPVAGCCPSGYACGTASCSLSGPAGTGTVQKVFPSGNGGGPALPRGRWRDGGVAAFVLGVVGLL